MVLTAAASAATTVTAAAPANAAAKAPGSPSLSTSTSARAADTLAAQAPAVWPEAIKAVVGHVTRLPLPAAISRVVIGDPRVADYRLISRTELYILGKSIGTTNLMLWRPNAAPLSISVSAEADLSPLEASLRRALPQERDISLTMASGAVMISGTVTNLAAAEAALQLAQSYARQLNRYLASGSGNSGASPASSAASGAPAGASAGSSAGSSSSAGTAAPSAQATQVINLLSVRDDQRLAALSHSLAVALPQEQGIGLSLASGSVVLSGSVSNTLAADAVLSLTEAYLRGAGGTVAGPSRVINLLRVRDAQQVMLDVRIAEVSKTLIDKLGLRVQASGGADMRWNILSNFLGGGSAVAGLLWRNGNAVDLEAEKKDGLVRILAEPTIVAMSGQEGSFLVGGKVFIPVTQSNGAAGSTITLQEREFGVGLKFVPTVLDGGRISLKVAPEVSEISRESVTVGGQGNASSVLPAFTTRRVSTTVQLQDGQSLVIGGLVRNSSSASANAFPLLGELPVLGALFRSKQFSSDLTELVVVVRASLVQATEAAPALPTDKVSTPTRQEFFLAPGLQGRSEPAEAGRTHAK
jgi:pilus assembly protein CpaC